jgi:hypothetical protein
MGQFIDQVNKTNQLIMSARQLKEQEKEEKAKQKRREEFSKDMQKNALQDLQNTFKDIYEVEGVKAFDFLNKINVRNKFINDIIKEYKKDKINTVTLEKIYNNLESNYLKINKNLYNIYNASDNEVVKNYKIIENYIKYTYKTEKKPQNFIFLAKEKLIDKLSDNKNYIKYSNYYDKIAKQYEKIYCGNEKKFTLEDTTKAILTGACIGIYASYKTKTKKKKRRF